jgi:hypothetical protein
MSETTTTTADEATVIAANIRHSCGFQYGRPSDRVLITRTARGWTRIADMLDELAQLRAATRWVPVSERNPVDGARDSTPFGIRRLATGIYVASRAL